MDAPPDDPHFGAAVLAPGHLLPRQELHTHMIKKSENKIIGRIPSKRCCRFTVWGMARFN